MDEYDFSNKPDYDFLVKRITNFLSKKSLYEKKQQNEHNQTNLGNCGFYFKIEDDKSYLCWTKHPKLWDMSRILKDIEDYEKYMLIQQGHTIEF